MIRGLLPINTHSYIHTYIHTRIHTYIHTHIHTHIQIHSYILYVVYMNCYVVYMKSYIPHNSLESHFGKHGQLSPSTHPSLRYLLEVIEDLVWAWQLFIATLKRMRVRFLHGTYINNLFADVPIFLRIAEIFCAPNVVTYLIKIRLDEEMNLSAHLPHEEVTWPMPL